MAWHPPQGVGVRLDPTWYWRAVWDAVYTAADDRNVYKRFKLVPHPVITVEVAWRPTRLSGKSDTLYDSLPLRVYPRYEDLPTYREEIDFWS